MVVGVHEEEEEKKKEEQQEQEEEKVAQFMANKNQTVI